ncbi:MAG: aminoacyl-tRNA hydrolase [Pseudomonadota bacterium]
MLLFIGLGNPGKKYEGNRHNIGFMVMDEIARQNNFPAFKSKFQGELSEGRIGTQKVALLKPQTFMNESGQSVGKAVKFFKLDLDKVIVFHDELDIEPRRTKVKQGGGTGGHNGLKSIDQHLGNKDYWRVRCGIGHPGDKNLVSGYVLNDFSKEEQAWLPDWVDDLARYADYLIDENHDDYMTRVNNF